ncbi:MAG: ATP-binding protein, partial [Dehalococcoidia bacterium]
TAAYIAPEQALGQAVTPRSDLYALGCVLYELVTGRPPFVGDESVALIGQHLNAIPVSPTWHRPGCPRALDALILRLLEKDPNKRPASAQAVADTLSGISPSAKRQTSESRQQGTTPSGTNPVYRRTFVGREAELRQLEAAFDATSGGQGGLVLVMGEPGIGKTTLTEQLATYASLRGGRTLVGHCYEEGSLSLPYLPFVETLRAYVLSRAPEQLQAELGKAAPDVARLVSEVRDRVAVEPAPAAGDTGEERYRLLQGVCSFLRSAATAQPLVLVLEDLHDADRGTLDLLTFLARQLSDSRLLVIGTYRDVEVDRQHPLSATLAELRRGPSFSRLLLRGLTADEVQRMLSAIAGQEVAWGLAEGVYRQTEGNPLFVQEVIRYLAEEGLITRENGRWQPAGAAPLVQSIPEGLRDVIGKRLSRLSASCNRLLAMAAVIGREFALQTLRAVAGVPEEELLGAVEEAVKVAVLQDQSQRSVLRYRFAHAFFRQTLAEELFAPRRLRLHQQIARALETQYAGRLDEHAAELAEHFAQSTDAEDLRKAIAYGEQAAQRARRVYAYGEAVRLLEQALAAQEVLDPDDQLRRCDLLLALGEALVPAGEPLRAAEQVLPEAFALAEACGNRDRAARACNLTLLAFSTYGSISITFRADYRVWVERMGQYAAPGTAAQVRADIALAELLGHDGDADARRRASALLRDALVRARQLDDPEPLYWAAWAIVIQPALADQPLALAIAEEFASRSHAGISAGLTTRGLGMTAQTLRNWGQRAQADRVHEQLRALGERTADPYARMATLADTVYVLKLDGRLEDAIATSQQLFDEATALGMAQLARQYHWALSRYALSALGRYDEMLARIAAFRAVSEAPDLLMQIRFHEAIALARLGRTDDARSKLDAVMRQYGRPDAS